MATRYQIVVKDTTGEQVAVLTDWRNLEYSKRVNGVGGYNLLIDGDSPKALLFDLDGIIEIKRVDLAASPTIPIYTDFQGFHRDEEQQTDGFGLVTFRSIGVGFNDLLGRRVIYFRTGTSGASKSGNGETVLKEYVNENGGPGVAVPARLESGVFPGFTVQVTAGGGSTWEGDRAFKRLLDVAKEIGEATDVDFQVIEGATPYTFIFTAKARPLGTDRSEGNAGGNPPVVFSLNFANMGDPAYTLSRRGEKNRIIVLGQGQPGFREVISRTSSATTDSPLNLIESMRNANQEEDTAGLNVVGDAALEVLQARETFRFNVIQQNSSRYGRDYFVGDIVTARYKEVQRNLQIVGVNIVVAQGLGEEIALTVSDVT